MACSGTALLFFYRHHTKHHGPALNWTDTAPTAPTEILWLQACPSVVLVVMSLVNGLLYACVTWDTIARAGMYRSWVFFRNASEGHGLSGLCFKEHCILHIVLASSALRTRSVAVFREPKHVFVLLCSFPTYQFSFMYTIWWLVKWSCIVCDHALN
jgi:hypothetical protein